MINSSCMDVEAGVNERFWRVNVSVGSFDHIRLPEVDRIWPKFLKQRFFSKHELLQTVALYRMVVETYA